MVLKVIKVLLANMDHPVLSVLLDFEGRRALKVTRARRVTVDAALRSESLVKSDLMERKERRDMKEEKAEKVNVDFQVCQAQSVAKVK